MICKVNYSFISAIVGNLEKYIYSKKVDLNLSTVVGEARFLLNNIKDLDNTDQLDKVEKILRFDRFSKFISAIHS